MTHKSSDPETSLARKAIVGTAWLMLWRMTTRSLGLVSTLILARLLIPVDFGIVAMATTFAYAIESLSQLGLQEALVRRREDSFDLHHTAFTLQIGRAILTAIALVASAPAVVWWFAEPRLQSVLTVLAGIAVLNGLENVGMAEYRRDMRFDMQFKVNTITRLTGFFTTLGSAFIWHSYWALLLGLLVSAVARVILSYIMHPFRPRLQITRWRDLAHFSFWTWATAVVSVVWDRCDPFVLGPTFGPAKLGLYLLALEISLLPVTEVILPAADALFSAFSRAQKDGSSSVHHAPEVAGIILLGVAPIVLSISAASGPITEVLLGTKWAEAWPVIAVLVWACIFSPYSFICGMALIANGHVKQNFVANAIMSAVKLAVLIAAISLTSDLFLIGIASAVCVAIESIAFLMILRGTGQINLRTIIGSIMRVTFGLVMAAGMLYWSNLGWQAATGALVSNLIRGIAIGVLSVGVFSLSVLLIWWAVGQPYGAEARLVGILRAYIPARMKGSANAS